MKIHEYQARALLENAGIPVPPGRAVGSASEAAAGYEQMCSGGAAQLAVVKAQVHAGGRGKAGFVKLVRSKKEAEEAARFMLTNRMVSPQTPPEGLEVAKLLVALGVDIEHEYYLAIAMDRASRRHVLIASSEGGVDIEQVAEENPEAIVREPMHPLIGLAPHQARRVAFELGFADKAVGQAASIMMKLAELYLAKDCTLAEINPLILAPPTQENPDGRVMAIDAKFSFDDNALFRHEDIAALFDPAEENEGELRAREFGLSYIALDGTIGCLVNGAGLAMATMDIIKHAGAAPANFLDVGGSADEAAVTEAFKIILADAAVKGVLVNIFGGIMRCDVIAQGIINAARAVGFAVPLVVRLEGAHAEAGRRLLDGADLPTLQSATDLADAAEKIVRAS